MKLKTLHEDIIGDLKRKLKGQVSLADNIRRVAQFELKSALARAETVDDLVSVIEKAIDNRELGHAKRELGKILKVSRNSTKELGKAIKDINKIK